MRTTVEVGATLLVVGATVVVGAIIVVDCIVVGICDVVAASVVGAKMRKRKVIVSAFISSFVNILFHC